MPKPNKSSRSEFKNQRTASYPTSSPTSHAAPLPEAMPPADLGHLPSLSTVLQAIGSNGTFGVSGATTGFSSHWVAFAFRRPPVPPSHSLPPLSYVIGGSDATTGFSSHSVAFAPRRPPVPPSHSLPSLSYVIGGPDALGPSFAKDYPWLGLTGLELLSSAAIDCVETASSTQSQEGHMPSTSLSRPKRERPWSPYFVHGFNGSSSDSSGSDISSDDSSLSDSSSFSDSSGSDISSEDDYKPVVSTRHSYSKS